jgi:hypothetical protein
LPCDLRYEAGDFVAGASVIRYSMRFPSTAASFSIVESLVSTLAGSRRATCDWEVPIAAATSVCVTTYRARSRPAGYRGAKNLSAIW